MKLTNYNDGPLYLPADGIAIEEDPPGQAKITVLATGLVFNVKESVDEVVRLQKEEKANG